MFKYKGLKVIEEDAALPKTRKDLFKTIVKEDFYLLAELSVLCFLFSIPLGLGFLWELLVIANPANEGALFSVCFYCGLIEIPLFGLRYIGRYAAFGVMKKRVHNEAGYIKELFFEHLKKGWKRGLVIGLILGVAVFLWQIASVFVMTYNANTWIKGLGVGGATLVFMVVFVVAEYFLSVDNFYELKFSGAWKNSFSFTIMFFPMSVLYFVVNMAIPFALTLVSYYSLIGIAAFFALWGDGFMVLVATLYSHTMFDRYINSVYYTDYINKGLSVTEKENDNG